MKTTSIWRFSKSALLLITIMLASCWSMAQTVNDPSLSDPNYDSQKMARTNQLRRTNGSSETDAVESSSLARPGSAAATNKATSACFIPLDASYTALPRNDDGSFGPIALPFTFDLYGSSYTQVWINTNGNLTFTGPFSSFSASGFPFSQPMVAPFWGDVDTRNTAGGQIHYKLSATNLIVTWDNVGYYNNQVDKLNEFQAVISDGVDPITGLGQNVCFNYGDMQWTTGSASSGVGGFGGIPATVGVNKGNNVDFYQLGRFNQNNAVYDGPGGNPDGINYLDQQCYCSQVSSAVNIAPIANNFPSGVIDIDCGETYNLDFSFIPPEVNQTVSTTVNVNGACGTTFTATAGSLSNINFSLLGQQCNEGLNTITFTATDNGTPVESTTVTLLVNVGTCCDLSANSTGQDESCANQADGSIFVMTSGGTAPLSYSIDGGMTYSASPTFTGLATGSYEVVAQDVNGCMSTPEIITISGPTQLTSASSATSILCNGGTSTVTVTAAGGTAAYTGTGDFTVGAGTHTFDVTDANGCMTSTTITVTEPTPVVASATATSIDCNGGTADITVTGSGGTPMYTGGYAGEGTFTVTAGTYTYTVTDMNGCSSDVTITVDEPTLMVLSISATEILCNGETTDITVSATGGTAPYTGVGTYTESAGSYTYSVSDANGCTETISITVSEPTQLVASATATEILCNGETTDITVTATGGTAPYTGNIVYTESAGTYTYTVTDSKGCTSDVTITVSEPTQLTASISATEILCNGETTDITVVASGGTAPYTGDGVYTESAGTYTYTVTDSKGCSVDVTITVTEPTQLMASATATEILCNGETTDITVTATGGTAPYTGNIVYTESAGTYTYTVTDSKGCTADVTITVTEPTLLVASATATEILCFGETTDITVTATGGTAPYTGNVVYTESAGTYTYTVTDSKGCTSDVTITVTEPTLLTASATATEILCNGETTDITVVGSGGTPPYSGDGVYTEVAGTYTYTVTDSKGCSVDVTITVDEPTQLELDLAGCSVVYSGLGWAYSCATIDGTASNGTPGYTYAWSNGESTPSITVCPDSTTTYSLTVTDSKGCSVTQSWTVEVLDITCSNGGSSSSSGSGSNSGSGSSSNSGSGSNSGSSSSSASGPTYTSGPSCPSSASSGSGSSSNSGSGSGSSNDANSGSGSSSNSGSGSSSGSSSSCSLPSDGSSSCSSVSGMSSNNSSKADKKLKVLMCFNGMTYCVKAKHIDKKLACGYTLGPCDMQQSAACDNSVPTDSLAGANCVCSGRLTSISVKYIGPSNSTVDATAKSCGVSISSTSGLNTGDIFHVNAADGGLQYLRNTTYLTVAGSANGTVAIPTNCCNNPIGKTFFPFQIIGWVDNQGNNCGITDPNAMNVQIGAAGKDSELTVKEAKIAQYPNPASSSATFEFSVPTTEMVSVSIVNINGELISTIFSEEVEADRAYSVTQDVSELQSGIYFVHMNTAEGVIKKKFVVLK